MKTILLVIIAVASFASVRSQVPSLEKNIEYEPNVAYPYGRLNPKAPKETAQFGFMIGVFDCVDQVPGPEDGKWIKSKTVWTSKYFLNGFGVQDTFVNPTTVAMGTRIFDPGKGKWIVNYFQSQPSYFAGVWEGLKEGENMIMRLERGENENRLTFSQIKKDGFEWIGEIVNGEKVTPFWKISCKRR